MTDLVNKTANPSTDDAIARRTGWDEYRASVALEQVE
jgi:hypothetical protein